jgi:uncharacterized protein (TIGR02266 family)
MMKSVAARYSTSLRVVFPAPEVQPEFAANISAGGMFLRTERRLAVGALVSVALEIPDGDRPAPLQGKVVHLVAPAQARSGGSGAGVGIQFIASHDPVRSRVKRYVESLARTTPPLERPKRTFYPRLQAPVYWRAYGLPFFRRRKPSIEDLGGMRVYLDEKLKEGARLEIEVFLPDETSVVCKVEVAWVEQLPDHAPARFDAGLKLTAITPADRRRLSSVLETGRQPVAH